MMWVGHKSGCLNGMTWKYEYLFYNEHDTPSDAALRMFNMTQLIPNTRHPLTNNIDIIFTLPVLEKYWLAWQEISHFKKKQSQGVDFISLHKDKQHVIVVMLPGVHQSDDEVMAAIAYLRMIEGVTGKVYVTRATHQAPSPAKIMNAVMGADPDTIIEVPDNDSPPDE